MNKKKKSIFIMLLIIVVTIMGTAYHLRKINEVVYITDNEFLYDIAIDYLSKKYTEEEKEDNQKENFHIFFDYEGFGISVKGNKKFAYMWIIEEAYYIENGELKSGSGSSMPYKITFENNKVVNFQVPEDGTYYVPSIRKMFPKDIANRILKYSIDSSKLDNEVRNYYNKEVNYGL